MRVLMEELEPRILLSGDGLLSELLALPQDTLVHSADDVSTEPVRHELVIFDTAIDDVETLMADIQRQADQDTAMAFVVLDSEGGLQALDEALSGHHDLDAVHIFSHGDAGSLVVAGEQLTASTLAGYQSLIASWRSLFNADADILLYGCNVAATAEGTAFVAALASATGTDVAASNDLTGAAPGGDWELEVRTGTLDSDVFGAPARWQGTLATITVDSNSDVADGQTSSVAALIVGPGADNRISLREAITAANNSPGPDTIIFNVPGVTAVITVTSPLPSITDTLVIDGTTDPNFSDHPVIELRGAAAGAGANGLVLAIGSDGSTIRSLNIQFFDGNGIRILSSGNTLAGNYIGTDGQGSIPRANDGDGIVIDNAGGNLIGGAGALDANIISGNGGNGISLTGVGAVGNVIEGNIIGLDDSGDGVLGNGGNGIKVSNGPADNVIGTTNGNLISGNAGDGIRIENADATLIRTNHIGTDVTGTDSRGNAGSGVVITSGASNNMIGGIVPGEGNLISGNLTAGVQILQAGSNDNQILGNLIGTDHTGTAVIGNGNYGIVVDQGAANTIIGSANGSGGNLVAGASIAGIRLGAASGSVIQGNYIGTGQGGVEVLANGAGILLNGTATDNLLGGTGVGEGNLIAFNNAAGVAISSATATGNAIIGNRIHSNVGLGIDLGPSGVTTNDTEDLDSGANERLNFPVITGLAQAGADLNITVDLDLPAGTYRIEIFENPIGIDSSQFGEGELLLGAFSLTTTGAAGYERFTRTLTSVTATAPNTVTATATRDNGGGVYRSTSEISPVFNQAFDLVVTTTDDVVDGNVTSVSALLGNRGADGEISLREAIIATNNSAGANSIMLPSGTYQLTRTGDAEDGGYTGDLDVIGDLVLEGAGAGSTQVIGDGGDRVFEILGSALTLSGVTISGGVENRGGGLYVDGTLDATDITVADNAATNRGGGIYVEDDGLLTLNRVTLTGNTAGNRGGALYTEGDTLSVTLQNVTISGNQAGAGAAIWSGATSTSVTNATIAYNTGGGIINDSGSFVLRNSILAFNTGDAFVGTFTSAGGNIDSGTSAGLTHATDQQNTDPLLGPLRLNGGQTATHALLASSPAIDAGVSAQAPSVDQRGETRIAAPDSGAYEFTNDSPPLITGINGDTLHYLEGSGAVTLDQTGDGTLSDSDPDEMADGVLTISIVSGGVSGEDVLGVRHQGTGVGQISVSGNVISYNGGAGAAAIGTFSGGSNGNPLTVNFNANATNAAASALLRNVTYNNTNNDAPLTSSRIVQFAVADGEGESVTETMTVHVMTVNDAPTLVTNAGATVAEGGNVVIGAGSLAVNDVDNTAAQISYTVVTAPVNGSLRLSGQSLTAGATFTQANINSSLLQYQHSGSETLADSFVFSVADGAGGSIGNTTFTIAVTPVNDVPVVSAIAGDVLAYLNGLGPQIIDQSANAAVSDADSADFSGGTLTVAITTGAAPAEDLLTVRDQGPGVGLISVAGSNVSFNFGAGPVVIGTASGGSGGTPLTITLNSSATATALTALVRNVSYENNDALTPTVGVRTASFSLSDGDGGTSLINSASIAVTAVGNLPPIISGISDDTLNYTEGDAASVIDGNGNALIADVNSLNFDGGHLIASIVSGGAVAEDILGIRDQGAGIGNVSLAGSDVRFDFGLGPVVIGTLTGGSNGVALTVTFNANATPAAATAVLANVTYVNTNNDDPVDSTRTVRFQVDDGDGGVSSTHDAQVTVAAVNDAPVVLVNTGVTVSEDSSVTIAQSALEVTDVDNIAHDLAYTLITAPTGGTLLLDGVALNAGGTFTQTDVESGKITYSHAGGEAPADSFVVDTADGNGGTTGNFTVSINVTPVNDAPVLTNLAGDTSIFTEGDGPVLLDVGAAAVLSDPDSPVLDGGTLTVSLVGTTDADDEVISVRDQGAGVGLVTVSGSDVRYDFGAGPVVIGTLTGGTLGAPLSIALNNNASVTAVESLIRNFTYQNLNTANPDSHTHTLRILLSDGDGATTGAVDVNLVVADVNDVPVLAANGGITVTEGAATTISNVQLSVTDVDDSAAALDFTLTTVPANGTLSLNGAALSSGAVFTQADIDNGVLTYAHSGNESVSDSFTFSVSDSAGATTGPATFTISVTPVNDAPVLAGLNGDTVNFVEDSAPVLLDIGVAASGSDVDSMDFAGGTVTVTISAGADINEDVLGIRSQADTAGNITVTGSQVAFDGGSGRVTIGTFTGGSGTPLQIALNANADSAAVSALLRNLVYSNSDTANPTAGARTIDISFSDGDGAVSNTEQVIVNVLQANDAPVITSPAVGGSAIFTIAENNAAVATYSGQDVDLPAQTLVFSIVGGADQALFSMSPNGVLAFRAASDFELPADADGNNVYQLTIALGDGAGGSVQQDLAIQVTDINELPTATDVAYTIERGGSLEVAASAMTSVVSDPDGDPLQFRILQGPQFAAAFTFNADGSFSYQHDASTHAADSFTYEVSDGRGGIASATVSIAAPDPNTPPRLAANGEVTVFEGSTSVISSAQLRVQDNESDSTGITFTVLSLPGQGVLQRDGQALTVGATFTQAEVDAGLLTYTHTPGSNITLDAVRVVATDESGAATSEFTLLLNIRFSTEEDNVLVASVDPVDEPIPAPDETVITEEQDVAQSDESLQDPVPEDAIFGDTPDDILADQTIYASDLDGSFTLIAMDRENSIRTGAASVAATAGLTNALRNSFADLGQVPQDFTSVLDEPLTALAFANDVGQLRSLLDAETAQEQGLVASSIAMSTGLSIGYVVWLIRGGVLMTSMLSSLPAWRQLDPLPVLGHVSRNDDDDDAESLHDIVQRRSSSLTSAEVD
ncbi:MAG: DUF4347 domain-containing protein [Gammaproteobacteria bacterium]|nr:DUF4347 domain-containing protein [Gammaproteobacteria bacterium]